MRILLLNLYYPPDTSATAKMAETVVNALRETHEVTVLCGRPSYQPTERRAWRLWQTEYLEERAAKRKVRIIRVGSSDYSRARMSQRVFNYLSYVVLSVPRALVVKCDVVLGMTDPPFQGIVGAFVAGVKGKPYVYNIRDLYPDMAVGGSIVKPGVMTRIWDALHRWALKRATRVVVLGNDMRERIVAKGVDRTRVAVVRDGADISERNATAMDWQVIDAIRGNYKFVLVHAGNQGFYGAWETLVEAMRLLANDEIGLVFIGNGAQRATMEAAAAGCSSVRLLPFFPADKIPSVLAAADVHVVTIRSGLEGVIVPSKMYGIVAAGKPILAVAPRETDVATMGAQQGFAVAADPENPSQVAGVIRELYTNPQKVQEMGDAARRAASGYDRVSELEKFTQVMSEAGRA